MDIEIIIWISSFSKQQMNGDYMCLFGNSDKQIHVPIFLYIIMNTCINDNGFLANAGTFGYKWVIASHRKSSEHWFIPA